MSYSTKANSNSNSAHSNPNPHDPSIKLTSFYNIVAALREWNSKSPELTTHLEKSQLAQITIYPIVISNYLTKLQLEEIRFQAMRLLKPLQVGSVGSNKLCHIIQECDHHLNLIKAGTRS